MIANHNIITLFGSYKYIKKSLFYCSLLKIILNSTKDEGLQQYPVVITLYEKTTNSPKKNYVYLEFKQIIWNYSNKILTMNVLDSQRRLTKSFKRNNKFISDFLPQ